MSTIKRTLANIINKNISIDTELDTLDLRQCDNMLNVNFDSRVKTINQH